MTIKLCWTDNYGQTHDVIKDCGLAPIMVRVSVRLMKEYNIEGLAVS